MSARIALNTVSMSAVTISDKQPRLGRDGRKGATARGPAVNDDAPRHSWDQPGTLHDQVLADTEILADDDLALPPETLFEAALIANRLPHRPASLLALQLRAHHHWLPPDSTLSLKDKTI